MRFLKRKRVECEPLTTEGQDEPPPQMMTCRLDPDRSLTLTLSKSAVYCRHDVAAPALTSPASSPIAAHPPLFFSYTTLESASARCVSACSYAVPPQLVPPHDLSAKNLLAAFRFDRAPTGIYSVKGAAAP